MPLPMRLCVALLFLGCANTVGPVVDASGELSSPPVDAAVLDQTAVDVAQTADAPVDERSCVERQIACSSGSDTACGSACSTCFGVSAAGRFLGGLCMPPFDGLGAGCTNSGMLSRCSFDGRLCFGPAPGVERAEGLCIEAAQCVALERIAQAGLRPGEQPSGRCQWGDGTIARTGVSAPARCLEAPLRTCGTGCAPCPADRPNCLWRSEVYPTGICLPIGYGLSAVGVFEAPDIVRYRCRVSPQQVCPRGESCLLPVRNDVDMPDINRWGKCFPTPVCTEFATLFRDGYRCDTALTVP